MGTLGELPNKYSTNQMCLKAHQKAALGLVNFNRDFPAIFITHPTQFAKLCIFKFLLYRR